LASAPSAGLSKVPRPASREDWSQDAEDVHIHKSTFFQMLEAGANVSALKRLPNKLKLNDPDQSNAEADKSSGENGKSVGLDGATKETRSGWFNFTRDKSVEDNKPTPAPSRVTLPYKSKRIDSRGPQDGLGDF